MVKFYEQICEQDRLNYIKDLKRSIDFNTYPKMLEFMQTEQLYITNVCNLYVNIFLGLNMHIENSIFSINSN